MGLPAWRVTSYEGTDRLRHLEAGVQAAILGNHVTRAQGFVAETWSRIGNQNESTFDSGTAFGTLVGLVAGMAVTNVHLDVTVAGAGVTHAQAGIYSPDLVTRYTATGDT